MVTFFRDAQALRTGFSGTGVPDPLHNAQTDIALERD
jgi:hypothetical protein